ncbi:MAG: IS607 family transposase, partial [Actinomycetota bacterium]|nr:IS607 family transposase [Actinomycetota bacterium]
MKLAQWARSYGVHPNTAYRWFCDGTMPVPARRLASGTIVVEQQPANLASGRTVAYCRVSSHDQRDDLERQAGRVSLWASEHGLSDGEVARIVVEHRDRLARFGVEHLAAALSAHRRRILVVDEGEV